MTDATRLRLSKSKIMAYEHCAKRLWLQVHRPELARLDPATLALFRSGHLVGDLAQRQLPDGILVLAKPNVEAAIHRTRQLLAGSRPIFEATFHHQDVIIRADILQPDGRGGWQLIEVKNSARVQSYQLYDVATQAWTALGAGARISSFAVRHVATKVRREADLSRCVFIDVDVTWPIIGSLPRRSRVIEAARACLRGPEPVRRMGRHCERPLACEFREFCSGRLAEQGKLPL
jgi:hypothetical protein